MVFGEKQLPENVNRTQMHNYFVLIVLMHDNFRE